MAMIDMTKVYQHYKGKWVALEGPNSNKVVASGKNLNKVVEEAQKKGFNMPLMMQIPKQILPIVGSPQVIK